MSMLKIIFKEKLYNVLGIKKLKIEIIEPMQDEKKS
jgi:hypothetical protein